MSVRQILIKPSFLGTLNSIYKRRKFESGLNSRIVQKCNTLSQYSAFNNSLLLFYHQFDIIYNNNNILGT